MISSLRQSIQRAKIDSMLGEELFKETEEFFRSNAYLKKMIQKKPATAEKTRASSYRNRTSHIY